MKHEDRERPIKARSADARTAEDGGRARRGWLGALLLCVLLAAAGLPAPAGAHADGAHVELRVERGHRPRPAELTAASVRPDLSAFAGRSPRARPQSRVRSIADGGLPPPRAPTA